MAQLTLIHACTPPPHRIIEYVAVYYGIAAAIGMFAAVCALLLAGFLGYQCWLITGGTTTYEAAKLRELRERRARAARRRRSSEGEGEGEGKDDEGSGGSGVEGVHAERRGGCSTPMASLQVANPFHRGSIWANFSEVLFPDRFMRQQLSARERRASGRRQQQQQQQRRMEHVQQQGPDSTGGTEVKAHLLEANAPNPPQRSRQRVHSKHCELH